MFTRAGNSQDNKSRDVASQPSNKMAGSQATFQLEDNRPEAIQLRNLGAMVENSSQAASTARLQTMANNNPYSVAQRIVAERLSGGPVQKNENKTGMPDELKSGIENLSGLSLGDVKVHYNSSKPATLQALAYTQGANIHVGPGQEKHLPHEAWHAVQQKQGRVTPTTQMKAGVNINNDKSLEHEADVMGARAVRMEAPADLVQENDSTAGASVVTQQRSIRAPDGVAQLATISNVTVATAHGDGNANRKKVGIGEKVTLTGDAAGDWSATSGTLPVDKTGKLSVVWQAPDVADASAKIELKVAADNKADVTFNVVEPSDAFFTGKGAYTIYPSDGAGASFEGQNSEFKPSDVSFKNVEHREGGGVSTGTGAWKAAGVVGMTHSNGTWTQLDDSNNDQSPDEVGNWFDRDDWKKTDSNGQAKDGGAGSYAWPIEWQYRVKTPAGTIGQFIMTHAAVADANAKVKVSKGGKDEERAAPGAT